MDADFLIVGGGIAGISAAARLSALGSVILLEAESQFATHASGRSAALYEPYYGKAPVVALSLAGGDYLRGHAGGYLSPRGLMIVAAKGEGDAFDADRATMRLDEISPDEARALVPILNPQTVHRAAHAHHAWDIDTDLLIQNFLRDLRANGGRALTGRRVTALARIPGGWRASAGEHDIAARQIVNAAGPWADAVAAMAGVAPVGLVPYRRSMARIAAPGGAEVTHWPMIFGVGETWYAKPDAGALIVSPADEDPAEAHDAWADDMVLAEGLARYEEMVATPVTRPLATWAGLRTFAPDRSLVIGPDPACPDFLWSAGQGGYGFQTAPGASALLADLVAGRPAGHDAATLAALSPARFS